MRTNRTTIGRKQKWKEKQFYGRYKQLISNISHEKKMDVRDETITYIISESSKLAHKENKNSYNLVGKVIYLELGKKITFDHSNKWYVHNPTYILENDTLKLFCDFNIQTEHLISVRRQDFMIIN